MFISNAIPDRKMSFEIKHTSSTISCSNWENLKHIELQSNLPACLTKKGVEAKYHQLCLVKLYSKYRDFKRRKFVDEYQDEFAQSMYTLLFLLSGGY